MFFANSLKTQIEELLANKNKSSAKTSMIGLLQMEVESTERLYELLFRSGRADIFNFAHSARTQYDHERSNSPTNS